MASDRSQRRLAAILAADVVGYSRLMEADEEETHARLRELRREAIDPQIRTHRGRVVKNTGDGFLAIFDSVVGGLRCATALQRAVAAKEASRPPQTQIAFRIGLNLGDVIVEGGDVYGDGVNIAARLQQFAEPGGIVISAAVREQVGGRLEVAAADLGELRLRHIDRAVRAYSLQPTGPRTPVARPQRQSTHQASIAVLPFRSLEPDPSGEYFGDGIVEDIVGALAGLKELFVISHGSTLAYRGPTIDNRAVGRSFGVRYVLSGSVRRTPRRLRIAAELSDTDAGNVIWADRFDGETADLFEVQDRISSQIVYTIAPQVREAELRRALRKHPDKMDAYDLVLHALDLLYRLDRESFLRARPLLQQAIGIEPGYAMAYAMAALWHMFMVGQGWSPDPQAHAMEAERLANKAIELDGYNALALAVAGHGKSFLFRDYDAAIGLFDRALAASPNSAIAWALSSPTYSYLGDAVTAIARAEQGLRLSPLDPHGFFYHTALTLAHYVNGSYAEAVKWGRKVIGENPAFTGNLRFLAASLVALGRLDEAREVGRMMLQIEPGFHLTPYIRRYAIKDEKRRARFGEQLRLAGLPD